MISNCSLFLDARAKVKRNKKKWYERKIVPTMVVEKLHIKIMNGNVIYVGLNFQERVEEKHPKKEGNNGEAYLGIHARALLSYSGNPSFLLVSKILC
jgi:hypothetical protein